MWTHLCKPPWADEGSRDGTERPQTHHKEGNGARTTYSPVLSKPLPGEVSTTTSSPVSKHACAKPAFTYKGEMVRRHQKYSHRPGSKHMSGITAPSGCLSL